MKKLKDIKLFPKIFLLTFSIMTFITILIHISIYIIFPKVYIKSEEKNIQNKSKEIAESLKGEDLDTVKKVIDIYSKNNDIKINVNIKNNNINNNNNNDDSNDSSFKVDDLNPKTKTNILIIEEREIDLKDNQKVILQFIKGKDISDKAKNLSFNYLPYTFLLSLVITSIISYIYTKIILKPIEDIKKNINKMKKMDKKALLKITSNDEINEMKDTINSLYKTLLKSIDDLDLKNKEIIGMEKKKVEFLRSASHELKTPLASMKIILENMKYNIGKFKDRDKYLDVAIENVDKLNNMVKDIIYISSKKEINEDKEYIDLEKNIDEILKMHDVEIKDKNIKIENRINNKEIYSSRKNLNIILQNLISNAVNYTNESGQILIGSKLNCIYIKNDGVILDDEEIQNSFNLFEKLENKNQEKLGTGLGLYIVKNILEDEGFEYKFKRQKNGMVFIIKIKK